MGLSPHYTTGHIKRAALDFVGDSSNVLADHTNRQAVRAAIEQLESADAHLIGTVLNRVDLVRNPYYYSAYYRKEYARYYVKSTT